jgi:predicted DNA-binding protein with PD1-like motif
MRQITKRLTNGQDLRKEIEKLLEEEKVKAGVIVSCVGSLDPAVVRMPVVDKPVVRTYNEPLEIVSMTGTVSTHGHHVHLSFSDGKGNVYGGHLKEGCKVRTTVELVILAFDDMEYKRLPDTETGYEELVVE